MTEASETASEREEDEREAYADDTIMSDVLGGSAKVRILDALISEADRDLNASDVARLAGIDRSTFYNHVERLQAYGLVERTRTVGNSPMYQINRESEAAERLAQFSWDLVDVLADAEQDGRLDENGRPVLEIE